MMVYKPKCFKVNQKLYCFPKVSQSGSANGIMLTNVSDSAHALFLPIFSYMLSNTYIYVLNFLLIAVISQHSVYSASWFDCCLASCPTGGNGIISSLCLQMGLLFQSY